MKRNASFQPKARGVTEFSLGECLARRRRLRGDELVRLLAFLPALLDDLEDPGCIGALLCDTFVVFDDGDIPSERHLDVSVHQWPGFHLQLRPSDAATESRTKPAFGLHFRDLPTRFGALIYELLGGAAQISEEGHFRFIPVSGVGEAGNQVLQEMLVPGMHPDCSSAWERWLRRSGTTSREESPCSFRIPKWALSFGQYATAMEFVPKSRRQKTLRFVAREHFTIGRSIRTADLPVGIKVRLGDVDSNHHLSRKHITGTLHEGLVHFYDGNGSTPSSNGSGIHDKRLETDTGYLFDTACELTLAPGVCHCRLLAEPVPHLFPRGLTIENLYEWVAPHVPRESLDDAPFASITFRPLGDATLLRESVWLFSHIGLGTGKNGQLECLTNSLPDWCFLYRHGCFWLACLREPTERVTVDDATLARGYIVPLHEHLLDFGTSRFSCRVPSL